VAWSSRPWLSHRPRRPRCERRPLGTLTATITLDDLRDARNRLKPVIRPTPVARPDSLSRLAGRRLLLKPEQLQRTGSFKIRGAYNFVSRLPPGSPVVAASAGNHAQGVALAAHLTGRRATIFMPANAALPKVQATRDYGAEVRTGGDTVDDCIAAARAWADAHGAVFVPPFDDPRVIAGQGTIGLELADEAPDAEVVVVAIGGGGLAAGVAAALGHTRPTTRVVGVQAEGAASMVASLAAGHPVRLENLRTMADGIAVRAPSALTFSLVHDLIDEVVTVTDEEISQAILLLLERAKAVVEPAGAAPLAAVLAGKVAGEGPVACVLSGGNVDSRLLTKLIDHGLSAAGRYLVLRVLLEDRPGALAGLTAAVAAMGLNVLSVEHHREGVVLPIDEVEVLLTLETRDPEHRDEVVRSLAAAGHRVELIR
jgi:threonine dehydratase